MMATAPRRRPAWPWAAAVAAAAVVGVVLVWFQPQKLFIDTRVDDAVPTIADPATNGTGAAAAPAATAAAGDLVTGTFMSLDHGTSGTVRLFDLGDGSRVVRLEGLHTENGPDLYLYLSANAAGGPEQAFDDDYVSLGRLKGNLGDQNYDLPAGTDLARYRSVVIWCDRFNSAFGAAELRTA